MWNNNWMLSDQGNGTESGSWMDVTSWELIVLVCCSIVFLLLMLFIIFWVVSSIRARKRKGSSRRRATLTSANSPRRPHPSAERKSRNLYRRVGGGQLVARENPVKVNTKSEYVKGPPKRTVSEPIGQSNANPANIRLEWKKKVFWSSQLHGIGRPTPHRILRRGQSHQSNRVSIIAKKLRPKFGSIEPSSNATGAAGKTGISANRVGNGAISGARLPTATPSCH